MDKELQIKRYKKLQLVSNTEIGLFIDSLHCRRICPLTCRCSCWKTIGPVHQAKIYILTFWCPVFPTNLNAQNRKREREPDLCDSAEHQQWPLPKYLLGQSLACLRGRNVWVRDWRSIVKVSPRVSLRDCINWDCLENLMQTWKNKTEYVA